jgi:UDP-N-acetylglucosamine--N-acetylmuramyl-(pentapeptide) pyrophosphoryl-undecaprenol N-acetylglucosamine transferase
VPALMVPLPHAVGGHQAANAKVLAHAGGVVAIPDDELDGARLVREADDLLGQPRQLARMAKTMRDLSRPDAADRLAHVVTTAAARRKPR